MPPTPRSPRAIEEAVAWLHEVDARFSPFREDSEIRRLDRGELALDDCHPDVRDVLRACDDLRTATGGAFDARGHRSGRPARPLRLREGLGGRRGRRPAGRRRRALVRDQRRRRHRRPGRAGAGRAWRVGHPPSGRRRPGRGGPRSSRGRAVATSGLYERGGHIRDPRTGRVPGRLRQRDRRRADARRAPTPTRRRRSRWARRPGRVRGRPGCGVLAIDRWRASPRGRTSSTALLRSDRPAAVAGFRLASGWRVQRGSNDVSPRPPGDHR